jgi:hypothetical protein
MNRLTYPESKPEILILGRDSLNSSIWKHKLVRLDIINRKAILARLPGIAFFSYLFVNETGQTGRPLTATKSKASNANT